MSPVDKRVDQYIAKAKPFAQPILTHLRGLVHHACPDVRETIKWGFPNFEFNGLLCNMAAFSQHCAFNFWKGSLLKDADAMPGKNEPGMGNLGKIRQLGDLPSDPKIIRWIKEAMELNQKKIKAPSKPKPSAQPMPIPKSFEEALKKNSVASGQFDRFSPSHKKEYIQWIAEAKTEETRNKRILTALEWIREGKGRNWKYEKKAK